MTNRPDSLACRPRRLRRGRPHPRRRPACAGRRGQCLRPQAGRTARPRRCATTPATHGVTLAASHAELAARADLIVSAVTASQAVPVAQACAPGGEAGRVLPRLQLGLARRQAARRGADRRRGRALCRRRGDDLDPALPHQGAAAAGRARARLRWQPLLDALGFDAKVASEKLGVASATKMCRSVMIKGLEAMVIESFTTARAYGVEDAVLASLKETFPGIDWEKQGAYFFQRVIEHGRRRSEEVREVAETVREAGLTPWSAQRHRRAPGLGGRPGRRRPVRRQGQRRASRAAPTGAPRPTASWPI